MPPIPNIVFFGTAGSGKSSIINMLAGEQVAAVANGLRGCTFESSCYEVKIYGSTFNLWDTAGLNEAVTGKVPDAKATISLFHLLKSLDSGLNLLVFCMRGPKVKDVAPINWRLFHEIICDRKVPIIIAITHLEQEVSMDAWWDKNRGSFERHEMFPHGVACITAVRGPKTAPGVYRLDTEYTESRRKMMDLLKRSHLKDPWRVPLIEWFSTIVEKTKESRWWWGLFGWSSVEKVTETKVKNRKLIDLAERCGLKDEDAETLAEMISDA